MSESSSVPMVALRKRLLAAARTLRAYGAQVRAAVFAAPRLRREAELLMPEQRLQLVLDASRDGICDYDFATAHLFVSAQAAQLLGYDETRQLQCGGNGAALQEFLWSRIHSDDRDRVARAVRSCQIASAPSVDIEVRCLSGAGVYRWLHVRGQVTHGPFAQIALNNAQLGRGQTVAGAQTEAGCPELLRFTACLSDVTQRKISEAMLQDTVSRLAAVLQHVADGVITLDAHGRIRSLNPAAERIFGVAEAEVLARDIATLVPYTNDDGLPLDAVFQQVLQQGASLGNRRDGSQFPLEILVTRMVVANAAMYTALVRDISERRRTELQMRHARETAEAGLRAKSEFLAVMSHEMRTPLNGVLGMTQLLLDSSLSAEQEETVYTIERSGTALLAIINDLLDFSKIEAGRMAIEHAAFDFVQVLQEALALVAPLACEKGIELIIDYPGNVPRWYVGDATRVRQVLLNLCGNAVKFTAHGHVAITVRQLSTAGEASTDAGDGDAHLCIAIEDTGIGIAQQPQERLFEPFAQMDPSTTRLFGGTGLGLAIARQLVELMGGSIRVASQLDVGSEFVFELRLRTVPNEHVMPLPSSVAADVPQGIARLFVPNARSAAVLARDIAACGYVVEQVATVDALMEDTAAELLVVDRGVIDRVVDADALAGALEPAMLARTLLLLPMGASVVRGHMKLLGFGSIATRPLHVDELRVAIAARQVAASSSSARAIEVAPTAESSCNEQPVPLDGVDVLVAEDNVINQRVAQRMLEHLGCRVHLASDGRAALAAWRAGQFAMIFMDVRMPKMDGLSATMQIREEELRLGLPPIPIVAMTANAEASDEQRCRAVGMSDFVGKPVAVSQLRLVLQRWLPGDDPVRNPVGNRVSHRVSHRVSNGVSNGARSGV